MDSRHSNDEFSSTISSCNLLQNRDKQDKRLLYNSIAIGDFAESPRRFEFMKPLFKVLSGQKEPKLPQTSQPPKEQIKPKAIERRF